MVCAGPLIAYLFDVFCKGGVIAGPDCGCDDLDGRLSGGVSGIDAGPIPSGRGWPCTRRLYQIEVGKTRAEGP